MRRLALGKGSRRFDSLGLLASLSGKSRSLFVREMIMLLCGTLVFTPLAAMAQPTTDRPTSLSPRVAPASSEGELAIKRFQAPSGLKVDLWAAEPLLANPVSFAFDEKGRAYVCETFRLGAGVDDIRGIMPWLDEELASKSPSDRVAEMKRHLGNLPIHKADIESRRAALSPMPEGLSQILTKQELRDLVGYLATLK